MLFWMYFQKEEWEPWHKQREGRQRDPFSEEFMWACTAKTILIDRDLFHGKPKWLLADCAVVFSTMILLVSRDREVSSNRNGV